MCDASRHRVTKLRCILLGIALALSINATASSNEIAVQRDHRGVRLLAFAALPNEHFDASLLPAEEGLRRIASALDSLVRNSPLSAKALIGLKNSGRVTLVYKSGDLRNPHGGENIATYLPDYALKSENPDRTKDFLVIVGRHGVKWPADELAATLAHELVGHATQQRRGRLTSIRHIDAECEASLYEEIANQDLKLDKHSRKMITFRKALEYHWCADFKTYMAAYRPSESLLWDTLNPDMLKLLAVFEDYLSHSARIGVTASSINALKRQTREQRRRIMAGASPENLFRIALKLRDGAIGIRPDPTEASRYLRLAENNGYARAWIDLAPIYDTGNAK